LIRSDKNTLNFLGSEPNCKLPAVSVPRGIRLLPRSSQEPPHNGHHQATRPASRAVGTPTTPVSTPSSPAPSQQVLPYDGLEVASSERVGGWIVLADLYGVRVAGGRTLTLVDPQTGTTTPAGRGPWDYDYTVLAEYEGGTVFLASGGTLWELTLDGAVIHRFDLGTLGPSTPSTSARSIAEAYGSRDPAYPRATSWRE
jgi:hypothetical protein